MRSWLTVPLMMLAVVSLPTDLGAQARGAGGSHPPHGPTSRPHPGHPPPAPSPSINQPFRSTIIFRPVSVANGHRPLPFRSSLFGLVVFDPYWWWTPDTVGEAAMLPPVPSSEPRLMGGLQLDVEPRRALVYVDDVYVGIVDAFSGYYHHLETTAGPHRILLIAADYDPLIADVMVPVGHTATYRASMNRAPGR